MNEDITKLLQQFGVSKQGAELYVAALSLPQASVSELAKKVKIQRTAVYFHLDQLLKTDLIRLSQKGKSNTYVATPPPELAKRFQRQVAAFQNSIPRLESLYITNRETPTFTVKEFKHGYAEFYTDLSYLPEGSEFRVLQGKKSADVELDILRAEEWKSIFKRLVDRQITTRAIFTPELVATIHQKLGLETFAIFRQRLWQLRTVQEERFPFEELIITGNSSTFLLTEAGIILTIHHKGIARSLTSVFDALWLTGTVKKF